MVDYRTVCDRGLAAAGAGHGNGFGLRHCGPFVLSLFAGAGTVVSPKATTGAICPTYTFYAMCGLVLSAAYYFGIETKNKSIAEIEALVTSGSHGAGSKSARA